MDDNQVKVGAVVPWSQVPDGALVRWLCSGRGLEYYRRHAHVVSLVGAPGMEWRAPGGDDGTFDSSEPVIVVALGLTGKESAADLRRLAEVYEIREHLMRTGDDSIWYGQDIDDLAPRLHAAGWRPGMTAEDAARLLASMKVAWLAKPPPGYEVDDYSDVEFHWSAPDEHYDLGLDEHCGSGTKAECMAAAWAHFEAEHNPPGMQVFVWPKEKASEPTSWCIAPHGKRHVAECATCTPTACTHCWPVRGSRG